MSKFVAKFRRDRDYSDDYEFSYKKKKKDKFKSEPQDYSKLVRDDEYYYEKPSRSKSRKAY